MKIGLRGGHSPNCKGAIGLIDEQKCVRDLYYKLKVILEQYGHTVVDCNSNSSTVSGELNEGTNKANSNNVDIYIPLHMNAFNRVAQGCETYVYNSASTKAKNIGSRVCNNLATIGLQNRGVKYSQGLHDLRATRMECCLIELLFCDNQHDVNIWNSYGVERIAYLIANAIDSKIPIKKPAPSKPIENNSEVYYRVVCGSYKDKANAIEQQNKLKAKGFNSFLEAKRKK